VAKSEDTKTGPNLAKFSKEGYSSKGVILLAVMAVPVLMAAAMTMMIMVLHLPHIHNSVYSNMILHT
jgi:hypothetical protein